MTSTDNYTEELPEDLSMEIETLLEAGDEAADNENYQTAVDYYNKSLDKLPGEKTDWDEALHIYAALADAYFNMEDPQNALANYSRALMCPGGVESGYIWFGIGQSSHELGIEDKAEDAFMRAYMLEGEEIFEDLEPSYLALIDKHIRKK